MHLILYEMIYEEFCTNLLSSILSLLLWTTNFTPTYKGKKEVAHAGVSI